MRIAAIVLATALAACGALAETGATDAGAATDVTLDAPVDVALHDASASRDGSDAVAPDSGPAKDGSAPGVTVLAAGLSSPTNIVVDSTDVYWTTGPAPLIHRLGQVMSCAKAGCNRSPTVLATSQYDLPCFYNSGAVPTYPYGLAVTATYVYWFDERCDRFLTTGIYSYAIGDSGAISSGVYGGGLVGALAADATSLYSCTSTQTDPTRYLTRCTSVACATLAPCGSASSRALAVDAVDAYWTNQKAFGRAPTA
ncbi:MAG: hypothetical protein ACYDHH_32550 [Solirubrobacteraceae bacterium]